MISIPIIWITLILLIQWRSPRPHSIGLKDQQLSECPDSPNCVSSQVDTTDHVHFTLAIDFTQEGDMHNEILKLQDLSGFHLISQEDNYFHFECRTLLMRYIDDLELVIDPAGKIIHVRSASRLGHSDFGANRKRVERIRTLLSKP